MNKLLQALIKRAAEPSTWAGLGVIAATGGDIAKAVAERNYGVLVMAAAGAIAAALPEQRKPTEGGKE